jgi:hypothetical protein
MSPLPSNTKLLVLYNPVSQNLGYTATVTAEPQNAATAGVCFSVAHVDMAIDGSKMLVRNLWPAVTISNIKSMT